MVNLLVFVFGKADVDDLYLTSWREIMLQKISVAHKGLPFVWNPRFITVFGKAGHMTLNWTRWIQSAPQYSVSETTLSTSTSPGGFSPVTYPCKCESVSCYVIWRVTLRFCLYNGTLGLITPHDQGIKCLWHIGAYLPHYTASDRRTVRSYGCESPKSSVCDVTLPSVT